LVVSRALPRIYEAQALIELNADVIRPLGQKDDISGSGVGWWDTQEYYETQYKVVVSQRVLASVARDLDLVDDADFLDLGKQSDGPVTVDDAADILRPRVTVVPVKGSRLFTLHVQDTSPSRAKRICSAIASTYIDQNLQTAVNGSSDAVEWLSSQLKHVEGDLEANENALYSFKQQNDLPSISINDASNMLRVEMQELDTALTQTRTRKQELLARHAELDKVSADDPSVLPASELLGSPYFQAMRAQYQEAIRERDSLMAEGKGENHPLVREAAQKVATSRKALLEEVHNIQGAVDRDLAVVTKEESGEDALFESARKRAVALNMKEIEYHRLDRARDQNEKLHAMLLERLKDADLSRMMRVNNIRLIDDALEPTRPIRPRTVLNCGIGLAIGILFGLALVWLREQLDSTIKTPDELEDQLGVSFLGLIPELDDQSQQNVGRRKRRQQALEVPIELVVHQRPTSGIAEAARAIRTNLLFMNPDRPFKTLLVTSAAPSEGKTTVATSIAIALAQSGQRVCIVDCDLRRPRIHRIFRDSGLTGVTNYLVGDASLADIAKRTDVPNLWHIPAGPTPPNPADIVGSERFRSFLRELGETFDRVIIDSPPVVAVTDSAILSTLVDATVFVIRAFKTSKHLSSQGLRALRDVDAPIAGAVLNAVNLSRHEYSYYHYYYYKREGYSRQVSSDITTDVAADDSPPTSPPN
jgi:capsular exopolysaccharide synthesis family protein